jgi:hypothetical protein
MLRSKAGVWHEMAAFSSLAVPGKTLSLETAVDRFPPLATAYEH